MWFALDFYQRYSSHPKISFTRFNTKKGPGLLIRSASATQDSYRRMQTDRTCTEDSDLYSCTTKHLCLVLSEPSETLRRRVDRLAQVLVHHGNILNTNRTIKCPQDIATIALLIPAKRNTSWRHAPIPSWSQTIWSTHGLLLVLLTPPPHSSVTIPPPTDRSRYTKTRP